MNDGRLRGAGRALQHKACAYVQMTCPCTIVHRLLASLDDGRLRIIRGSPAAQGLCVRTNDKLVCTIVFRSLVDVNDGRLRGAGRALQHKACVRMRNVPVHISV